MRQNDIEKIIAYQKCFIGPLVWKCFTNNFELLLSEKEFPTFCTFFMYINVHGHQIFAKCTLNECTKMELDPPHEKLKAWIIFLNDETIERTNSLTVPLFQRGPLLQDMQEM